MNHKQQIPGINCPRCQQFIPTTVQELVTASSLHCPYCGLQLHIDRQSSRQALDALSKLNAAQENVENKSHFNR